ncbi:MAG: glycosyltransferase family 2 protein [Planctomycetia bacterium]
MSTPAVSIVVAARNNGPFLAECLDSTLRQTAPAREVVYVDDGSTDDSVAVARRFESAGVRVFARDHAGVVAVPPAGVRSGRRLVRRSRHVVGLDPGAQGFGLGRGVPSTAALGYRQHPGSWSVVHAERDERGAASTRWRGHSTARTIGIL